MKELIETLLNHKLILTIKEGKDGNTLEISLEKKQ